jgi:hypothetical protein
MFHAVRGVPCPPQYILERRDGTVNPTTPSIAYSNWPTIQPVGGTSEIVTDAEQTKPITEEGEAEVWDSYCSPIPRVADYLFDIRRPFCGK